ncbi:hypothetical protein ASPZODRAFT_127733 [Penicilliopsis zonata CBS 506.65]|uniref:Uncharacterized protein n=1 Tax=Penicilliopsis zonata CBS 506.65 TaxID=1073090 RepID=A0A1L9SWT1_9EURO|nr:hypothetical protein ASPZODRAFT_127733 [Penicilliopsis zonata CBS 506.65]OJJ51624.1 hypothetical protein ASPZODRAFT_127733 [Penicilliopsis zonata CBS 506.65]
MFALPHMPIQSSPLAPREPLLPLQGNVPSFPLFAMDGANNKNNNPPSSPDHTARTFTFASPSPSPSPSRSSPSFTSSRSKSSPSFAHRYAEQISNPLNNISRNTRTGRQCASSSSSSSASPSARDKRREIFLNRVRQDRTADRFEARGEQIMRMEYMAEQRQWGESMRRYADRYGRLLEEEEEEEVTSEDMQQDMQDDMLPNPEDIYEMHPSNDTYGDEEYDGIFMEMVDQGPSSQGMDMSVD